MTIDDLMCAIGTPLALVLFWLCVLNMTQQLRNFRQRAAGARLVGAAMGAVRGGLIGLVLAVGIMTYSFDRPNQSVYVAFETSRVGPLVVRYDFLAPFANKLEEELNEQEERPPSTDFDMGVAR